MEQLRLLFEPIGWLLTTIEAGGVIAAIVAYIKRDRLRPYFVKWLRPLNRFPQVGGELKQQLAAEAIIFTVSRQEVPAWVLEQYRPKFAGFIASEGSKAAAEELVEFAAGQNIHCLPIQPIEDPDDPRQSRDACGYLLESLKQKNVTDAVVDVTGGKVPMTLGAFMAAEAAGVNTLYVSSEFDVELKQPNMRTARLIQVSRANSDEI